tara:strand:+ start:442 stop:849 length:408 start_codon:yes stop_codon:yes gene_type:complete
MALTADQLRGRVRVLIDGEEVFLRFDQGALLRLLGDLGLEVLSDLPSAISTLDPTTLASLVWAGRLWELPELTRDAVDAWWYPLMPTYKCAIEAMNLALWGEPQPSVGGSDDDVDPPNQEEATAGGTSNKPEHLQ